MRCQWEKCQQGPSAQLFACCFLKREKILLCRTTKVPSSYRHPSIAHPCVPSNSSHSESLSLIPSEEGILFIRGDHEFQAVSGNYLAMSSVIQLLMCACDCSVQTLRSCFYWQAQYLYLSPGHQKALQLRLPASQAASLPASLYKDFLLFYSSSLFGGGLLSLWCQQSWCRHLS